MRTIAWCLKADGPRGKAGEVVGAGQLRPPFQVAISSPVGVVDKLTVTGAQFNHLWCWSEIQLPGGQVARVAVQSEAVPNFLFVRGSVLPVQTEVTLVEPVTLLLPLVNAICVVTDRPAPPAEGDDGEYVEIPGRVEGSLFHAGCSKPRLKVENGELKETSDVRPVLRVSADGETGEVITAKDAQASKAISFEFVDDKGDLLSDYDDPDFKVQLEKDHWASIPIAKGRGTLELTREKYGSYKFDSGERYKIEQPLHVIVTG